LTQGAIDGPSSVAESPTQPSGTPAPRSSRWVSSFRSIGHADTLGLLLFLILLGTFFSLKSPYFLSWSNFSAIAVAMSVYLTVACVQTTVLVSGGVDLSIMSTLALSGLVVQWALLEGLPVVVVLLAGLGVGAIVGLVNAGIILGVGVNALVATIGTAFAVRGIAFIWTGGAPQDYFTDTWLNEIGNGTVLGIRTPIVIAASVFVVVALAMRFTRFGSRIYAVGGSEYATRMSGIAVKRLRTLVYVLSGISAALGGLLLTAMNGTSFATAGYGEELLVLGAVIIGGTGLGGGRGTVFGTLLGVLLLGTLQNGFNLIGVQSYWQTFIQGVILIVAVTQDEIRRRARGR
jgi:ribose transport system permease protein